MTDDRETIDRARRWKAFWVEEGGLQDMLTFLRQMYGDSIMDAEPWETDKLQKYVVAGKVVDRLETLVQRIITDGKMSEHLAEHRRRMEELPMRKRRLLGWME